MISNNAINMLESELFKDYPRVAPNAEILGFTHEDIKGLLSKIENDIRASSYFDTNQSRQNSLKTIFIRLNLKKDDFYKHINFRKNNPVSDGVLQQDCGRYNLLAYKAILKF